MAWWRRLLRRWPAALFYAIEVGVLVAALVLCVQVSNRTTTVLEAHVQECVEKVKLVDVVLAAEDTAEDAVLTSLRANKEIYPFIEMLMRLLHPDATADASDLLHEDLRNQTRAVASGIVKLAASYDEKIVSAMAVVMEILDDIALSLVVLASIALGVRVVHVALVSGVFAYQAAVFAYPLTSTTSLRARFAARGVTLLSYTTEVAVAGISGVAAGVDYYVLGALEGSTKTLGCTLKSQMWEHARAASILAGTAAVLLFLEPIAVWRASRKNKQEDPDVLVPMVTL